MENNCRIKNELLKCRERDSRYNNNRTDPERKVRLFLGVTTIPSEKIFLGIPNYGYDWPLPFVQGTTRAQSISNQRAIELAVQYQIAIQYDETAQSPYFHYTDHAGVVHEVWFEDVRSLCEKFRLVKSYGLRGMGYWQIMQLFRANWLLLADTFSIQKRPAG